MFCCMRYEFISLDIYNHLVVNKSYCTLLYVALPSITKQPVSAKFKEGDLNVAALHCPAIGIGPIYYHWEKYNPSNYTWMNPSHRVLSTTTQNLKFSVITEEDEGIYHCIVTNDDGSVISDNATISVYGRCLLALTKLCDIACMM